MARHPSSHQAPLAGRLTRRGFLVGAARAGLGAAGLALLARAGALSAATAYAAPAWQASGSTLTVASGGDIDLFDPHINQLIIFNHTIRHTVFNSLVRYTETLEPKPELAESWESPDGRVYTFKLRQGVKFHNGRAVTADDVKFSLERVGKQNTVWASRVANVESIEVVDPGTVRVTLKTPQADFVDGIVRLSIVPPEAAEGLSKQPVGSGPWKFVEWLPNDQIVLERNPDYWEAGVPGVDRLVIKPIPDPQVQITNLKSGAIDGILDISVANAVEYKTSSEIVYVTPPASGSFHLFEMMGKKSEPMHNVKVRQALAHALDKKAIQQTVFFGEGKPKWSPIPSDSWAYADRPDAYPYDLDAAKKLLGEAGYGGGFEFTVEVPIGYPDGEKEATLWQASLARIGVKVNINTSEISQWVQKYVDHDYDVTWNEFPGFGDPNYFMALGIKPHLADQYQNEALGKLIDDANATLDQAKRKELYAQIQAILIDDLPIIVVQEKPVVSLIRPNVKGWVMNAAGDIILRGVRKE